MRILGPFLLSLGLAASPALAQSTDGASTDEPDAPAPPVAVIGFTVSGVAGRDALRAALDLASSPHLARLTTPREDAGEAMRGRLVFDSPDAARDWLEQDLETWSAPLQGAELVLSAEIYREDLLRRSDMQTVLDGLDELDIAYRNTGNDAAGDSDIDAVTVVCTGTEADCKPSN